MSSSKRIKYVSCTCIFSSNDASAILLTVDSLVAFKIIRTYVQFNYSISIPIREIRFSCVISSNKYRTSFMPTFLVEADSCDFFLVLFLLRGWPRVDDGHRSPSIHRQRTIYPVASPEIIGVGRRRFLIRIVLWCMVRLNHASSLRFFNNDIRKQYSFAADKI